MKKAIIIASLLALNCTAMTFAQKNDPVIMTINGQDVLRSEFEYSYNKNNSEGVIDKKSIEEYVDLFINYKLKVCAALDANMDTLTSFKNEYTEYRDQQIRPTLITDKDVEAEAKVIYQNTVDRLGDTLVQPAHILVLLPQNADEATQKAKKALADSIYNAVIAGADFAKLAKEKSDDKGSTEQGGVVGWIGKGQTVKEFEDAVFALKDGEISKPVLSSYGYHIIKRLGAKPFDSYETLRSDIMKFIDARGIREAIVNNKIEAILAKNEGLDKTTLMNQRADSLAAVDEDMKYLFQEYHDGLLLYEISNQLVWDKGAKDEEGLLKYFKKNKKKYTWDEPRFKGIAYHCKAQEDVEAVKKALKKKKFNEWAEILRATFNADSVLRIRAEKGVFSKGDSKLVDKEVFNDSEAQPREIKGYPYDSTYGKIIKKPEEMDDVRAQVTADYQDMLEKEWVEQLRKKYSFKVNEDILATVNKH